MKDVLTCAVVINKYNYYSFAEVNKWALCKSFRNNNNRGKNKNITNFPW